MFQMLGKQQIKFYSWANMSERTANLFYEFIRVFVRGTDGQATRED